MATDRRNRNANHEAAQRRARAQADAARRSRRSKAVAGSVLAIAVLFSLFAFLGAAGEDDSETTTTAPSTTTSLPGGVAPPKAPVDVTLPTSGATITDTTPCPAEDGSAERTTSFTGPAPMCLPTLPDGTVDPGLDVTATIHTNAGDLHFLLDTESAPVTTNEFVMLSRYGYFDGAPLDTILQGGWAEFGGAFADVELVESPTGYTLASEAGEKGTIPVPGGLAAVPTQDGTQSQGGRFLIALGENAAGLPVPTTFFGLLLDGTDAFSTTMRAGTDTGQPSAEIVIESIDVTTEPAA